MWHTDVCKCQPFVHIAVCSAELGRWGTIELCACDVCVNSGLCRLVHHVHRGTFTSCLLLVLVLLARGVVDVSLPTTC